jgi:hypothetical protein
MLINQHKSIAVLKIIFLLENFTRQPQGPNGFVNVNPEALITRTDLFRGRAVFALAKSTRSAQITEPYGKGEIIAVQKSRAFNLYNSPAELPGIVGMDQKDVFIRLDHSHPFFQGCPPGMTADTLLKVILTSPPAL